MTIAAPTQRRVAPRRRRAWLVALGGAGAAGALLAAPLAAQQVQASPGGSSATVVRVRLADVEREREQVAVLLRRLTETLGAREATPSANDSLLFLVRRYSVLGNEAARLDAQLRVANGQRQARQLAPAAPAPAGWFGVDVETLWSGDVQPGGRVLVSAEYPKVLSVEPGSPAARAGLVAGDRLIAISGTDLRSEAFDLRVALRPGRVLPVRIMRDGAMRDVLVSVTERPPTFSPGVTVRSTTTTSAAPSPAFGTVMQRHGEAPRAAAEAATPGQVLFFSGPEVVAIAGAEVLRLRPELWATLEVPSGVFVVQVARSSPAERSGLRQGDVLVRANGTSLATPLDFQRVVAEAVRASASVKVELMRDRKMRTVQLRW